MASHANRWLGAGALSVAFAVALSWVCCLPILAGLLGAGVASLGARIEPWRPYLLLAGALAVGWGLLASRRSACTDERCTTSASRRRVFLWICAAAIALAAAMPYLLGAWLWLTL